MGNMKDLMGMIPGADKAMKGVDIDDDAFKYIEAIIGSMTPTERTNPDLLNVNRKKRIAKGAGCDLNEVNQMVKQFHQMSKMMKKMQGGKGKQIMQMFQGGR
jgi:signal recognition particle subunit SRP54